MTQNALAQKGVEYLYKLSLEIPNRRTGSPGNRAATDFFAGLMASSGFTVEMPDFTCIDWHQDGAQLLASEASFEVQASPFSLGCRVSGSLLVVKTVEELEAAKSAGKVILLSGEIAKEQLMPKNFPFYNPEEHQKIIALLESQSPLAIVTATTENPEMAGALYPFPLIEDGDFNIPSVYTTEAEGLRLTAYAGKKVDVKIFAQRSPACGCNVVARKGDPHRRVVLFAHIDAKDGTSGAIDNAAGSVVLLLLAELLANYQGRLGVEIVAMNGEDYYNSPGEQLYLRLNEGRFDEIVLGVNIDGAGYVEGKTAFSLYNCPEELDRSIRQAFSLYPGLVEGEPWYQGDHGLFLLKQRPALAITSERVMDLESNYVHSKKDTPEIVDPGKLAKIALALRDLIVLLDRQM
jgi:aminopeptidase YwaD